MGSDVIGKVVHYYDKIGVAIVKLSKAIKIGDQIQFGKNENSFHQTVDSMQIEHKEISQGKAGEEVGIKVDKKAKVGTPVYSA